ncbi:kinase-like domain-containing protein [Phanerochaete sordida]|uniref:Kinase-like domain-containing protein n=1 Tax=Phanerochaete sordida TaxID=48140 RepID=A0A9P3LFE3_9APHY|nr:kinase-like domain-containing protein [Phanerochaete sordida]
MPPAAPAPPAGTIDLRFSQLIGSLSRSGLYTLHIKFNNGRSVVCKRNPSHNDTKMPDWGAFTLPIPAGTNTLVMELHDATSSTRTIPEPLAAVNVPVHELFKEVPLPFPLKRPGSSEKEKGPGFLTIRADATVDKLHNLAALSPSAVRHPAIRTLKAVLDALDVASVRYRSDKSLVRSINAARIFAQASLAYLTNDPRTQPQDIESKDFNVVWDLSRHLEQHMGYFANGFPSNSAMPPKTRAGVTQELLAAASEALAIIFGFLTAYSSATYTWVHGARPTISTAALDLQYRLLVLDARMRGIPGLEPAPKTESAFYGVLAGVLADHYKTIKEPSGTWYELLGCVRGKLAVRMLDGYKAYIDRLGGKSDPGNTVLRRTARRLMALLAHATMMLPSTLEIPATMFGKKESLPERTLATIVNGEKVASGGYAYVQFKRMKCPRRGVEIVVALKYIKRATTPDEIKHTYLEILNGWTLHHPRLLPTEGITHEIEEGQQKMLVVSEKMAGGVLAQYVCAAPKFTQRTPEQKTRILNLWIRQIAEGMKYMHDEGIAHGDLHPTNIFMKIGVDGSDHNVVIGDFGVSIYIDSASKQFLSTRSGAKGYVAPEQLITDDASARAYGVPKKVISPSRRPTAQSDLFSWAMLCVELYAQKRPFPELEINLVGIEIMKGRRPSPLPQALTAQPLLLACVKRCWSQDSAQRGDTAQMLADMRRIAPYDKP